MGSCTSKPSYITTTSGNERDYHLKYHESSTLGEGMFGTVKLIHDVTSNTNFIASKPLAVKYIKKGYTFRDNVLYTPMKREALVTEVEILRTLNGQCYTLQLVAVYESPSIIYIITEYCEGGEMMPWVSTAFANHPSTQPKHQHSSSAYTSSLEEGGGDGGGGGGLRTEDVSRIAYQLWSAVHHCAQHKVIHRDIKPENIMFCTKHRDSPLRLIDFGSGTMDGINNNNNNVKEEEELDRHHTFAGSAFYISPEMFQRTYTYKTDVWSVAVSLYVLVAGYPAERLQEAFNILQSSTSGGGGGGVGKSSSSRRTYTLPNMPKNIPESFHDMLEGALVYRHKARMDAGQLMQCEFAQFHFHHQEEQKQQMQQRQQQRGVTIHKPFDESGEKRGAISITEIVNEAAAADSTEDGEYNAEHAKGTPPRHLPERTIGNDYSSRSGSRRTQSILLESSVYRHNTYLGYQKFERTVTAILATMLSKETSTKLLLLLTEQQQQHNSNSSSCPDRDDTMETNKSTTLGMAITMEVIDKTTTATAGAGKLQVVTIEVLLELLRTMQGESAHEVEEVANKIQSMKNFQLYQNFAYHISLLRQFVSLHSSSTNNVRGDSTTKNNAVPSSVHGNNVWNTLKKKRGLGASGHSKDGSGHGNNDALSMSVGGMGRGMRRIVTATGSLSTMFHESGELKKE